MGTGRVLRTDATNVGTVSLVEYDHHGTRTWAVVATDPHGCLVSDLDDALLVTEGEAFDAYTRLLDHLHWLDTAIPPHLTADVLAMIKRGDFDG